MIKAGAISRGVKTEFNLAKQAALVMNEKVPLIYSSNPAYAPIAYRWKCQINENAKYPAFHHTFPEMNHNEIEAWENKKFNKLFIPLFIANLDDEENYAKRNAFFKKLMTAEGVEYLEFYAEGSSFFEKAFTLIYLGDIISYYLAILQQVNPTTIEFINKLKEEIS